MKPTYLCLATPVVNKHIERLYSALNHALSVSLKRKDHAMARFVRAIVLVKGIHFYGFHTGYAPFLKIHMIHPDKVSRAILILQSGSIMGTRMNVFEGHLSYPLQFLCDFNLYGCSWIDIRDPHFRRSPYEEDEEGMTRAVVSLLCEETNLSKMLNPNCTIRLPQCLWSWIWLRMIS